MDEVVKDCVDCEHFRRHRSRPSECGNYTLSDIVNGERTCALMRATLCGVGAVGMEPIDWGLRQSVRATYQKHAAHCHTEYTFIDMFISGRWRKRTTALKKEADELYPQTLGYINRWHRND